MYELIIKPSAEKEMDRLPARVRQRIVAALEGLREEPRPPGCAKLHGTDDFWRIRAGQYRVVYTIRDAALIVLVVRVAHRKDAYRP
ncbi:MAG: type II toxin-antitoxin system RelE family toxin [Gemmataceae bacterium]